MQCPAEKKQIPIVGTSAINPVPISILPGCIPGAVIVQIDLRNDDIFGISSGFSGTRPNMVVMLSSVLHFLM